MCDHARTQSLAKWWIDRRRCTLTGEQTPKCGFEEAAPDFHPMPERNTMQKTLVPNAKSGPRLLTAKEGALSDLPLQPTQVACGPKV